MKSLTTSRTNKDGFTLIEILITLALVGVVIAFGSVVNLDFYTREDRLNEQTTLESILQKARSDAMNNVNATNHGIHIESGAYIIFDSNPYDPSEPNNQIIERNPNIIISGLQNIVFKQLSGNTEDAGTIILKDTNNIEKFISIQTNGLINW